jgi:hypothetical protein
MLEIIVFLQQLPVTAVALAVVITTTLEALAVMVAQAVVQVQVFRQPQVARQLLTKDLMAQLQYRTGQEPQVVAVVQEPLEAQIVQAQVAQVVLVAQPQFLVRL